MITPKFKIDQSDDSVTVSVYAPNARLQDSELTITEESLLFVASPYFLR